MSRRVRSQARLESPGEGTGRDVFRRLGRSDRQESKDICRSFLRGHCSFGDSCIHYHLDASRTGDVRGGPGPPRFLLRRLPTELREPRETVNPVEVEAARLKAQRLRIEEELAQLEAVKRQLSLNAIRNQLQSDREVSAEDKGGPSTEQEPTSPASGEGEAATEVKEEPVSSDNDQPTGSGEDKRKHRKKKKKKEKSAEKTLKTDRDKRHKSRRDKTPKNIKRELKEPKPEPKSADQSADSSGTPFDIAADQRRKEDEIPAPAVPDRNPPGQRYPPDQRRSAQEPSLERRERSRESRDTRRPSPPRRSPEMSRNAPGRRSEASRPDARRDRSNHRDVPKKASRHPETSGRTETSRPRSPTQREPAWRDSARRQSASRSDPRPSGPPREPRMTRDPRPSGPPRETRDPRSGTREPRPETRDIREPRPSPNDRDSGSRGPRRRSPPLPTTSRTRAEPDTRRRTDGERGDRRPPSGSLDEFRRGGGSRNEDRRRNVPNPGLPRRTETPSDRRREVGRMSGNETGRMGGVGRGGVRGRPEAKRPPPLSHSSERRPPPRKSRRESPPRTQQRHSSQSTNSDRRRSASIRSMERLDNHRSSPQSLVARPAFSVKEEAPEQSLPIKTEPGLAEDESFMETTPQLGSTVKEEFTVREEISNEEEEEEAFSPISEEELYGISSDEDDLPPLHPPPADLAGLPWAELGEKEEVEEEREVEMEEVEEEPTLPRVSAKERFSDSAWFPLLPLSRRLLGPEQTAELVAEIPGLVFHADTAAAQALAAIERKETAKGIYAGRAGRNALSAREDLRLRRRLRRLPPAPTQLVNSS